MGRRIGCVRFANVVAEHWLTEGEVFERACEPAYTLAEEVRRF